MTDHPASAAHEIRGYLTYTDYGDSPYWQFDKVIRAFDGGRENINIDIDGERWVVSVGYQTGGLEPRPSDPIDDEKNLREYRVTAHGEEERKLPLLIQPRLDWGPERRPQSVPADLGLATNVKLEQTVNLEPDEIESLIPRIMRAIAEKAGVDWHRDYFTGTPHEYSSVTQYERYYRADREYARKIVRSDGIFHRLFHLLADLEGSKIVFSADNREIVGYNHQLRLPTQAVSEMFPDGTRHGMQLKHYHPENVRKDDTTDDGELDPLYHPKLGALFKKGLNDGAHPWHEIDQLGQELEETLVNVLEWADVPTKDPTAFVSDWHFDADERSDRDVALFDDPTPEIESNQESILISTLTRLSDRDQDVVERVARADGGTRVDAIAEDTDWSTSTVYRALRKLGDLLENDNGNVSFISAKIRDRVRELVDKLDRTVDATTRIIEDTLDVDPRDLERKGRAWQNWLTRYGAEIVREPDEHPQKDGKIRIREILSEYKSGSYEFANEVVDYGKIAWVKAGRDPDEFESAIVEYDTPDGGTTIDKVRTMLRDKRVG